MNEREKKWTDLMIAANAGDAAAYETLLRDVAAVLRPMIGRAFARAGRGVADVEDVVQETLIAIHLKRQTWDGVRPFGPWLRAIAHHKFIDALRRRGHRDHVPIDDFIELLPAAPADAPLSERDTRRQLDMLPARQRSVVSAIALDGASVGEVAQRLSMTQGAVRVALHRALATLARKSL